MERGTAKMMDYIKFFGDMLLVATFVFVLAVLLAVIVDCMTDDGGE